MILFFTTVIRAAPLAAGGELVSLDWDRKEVRARAPISPLDTSIRDENPRGNSRGGRGIWLTADTVFAAAYDGVLLFDYALNSTGSLSNVLMAGLHEVLMTSPGRLWITATALDAALEIDLSNSVVTREHWPREIPAFQKHFQITSLPIDKAVDQRTAFLSQAHTNQPGHLHLNAVGNWRGGTIALLNRFGAVVDLDRGEILMSDPVLRGGHNLIVRGDTLVTCATRDRSVRLYDLPSGRLVRSFPLQYYDIVQTVLAEHEREHSWRSSISARRNREIATPIFVRGLDILDDRLYVGFSPATIACIDIRTGEWLGHYQYSDDVRVCVHGLRISRKVAEYDG